MAAAGISSVPEHVAADRVFEFDVFGDPGLRDDLHAEYARVQRRVPDVFYTPSHGGHWVVTRYDAITSIVMDPEHFSVSEMHIPRVPNPTKLIPLNLDPPENVPYRQLLMPFFSPKAVGGMRENIRAHARTVIGEVAGRGSCNFVDEVASRFPVTVFMELMGFPIEELTHFRDLADRYFKARDEASVHEMAGLITAELIKIIQLRQQSPRDDMVSKLAHAKFQDRVLTLQEMVSICMLLFFGGLDTVTNASSFSARFLALNPALQDRLIREPESIDSYVEESLRMFGVVNTPRLVVKDCDRFGVRFRAGDMVLCNLPLAGLDDRKNPNPELFDMDRKNRSYLIFSTGPHLCLGHFLARVEMKILFTEWMSQIGRFKLADDYHPQYRAGLVMALEKLQLVWPTKAN